MSKATPFIGLLSQLLVIRGQVVKKVRSYLNYHSCLSLPTFYRPIKLHEIFNPSKVFKLLPRAAGSSWSVFTPSFLHRIIPSSRPRLPLVSSGALDARLAELGRLLDGEHGLGVALLELNPANIKIINIVCCKVAVGKYSADLVSVGCFVLEREIRLPVEGLWSR